MTQKELHEIKKRLERYAATIMHTKQPEYTNQNQDVLINFKQTAENLGLEPLEVWAVFFHKHVQSILTHCHNPGMNQAEPIESRFADALNYIYLGYGLLHDCKYESGK
jgi:hypothetical protein